MKTRRVAIAIVLLVVVAGIGTYVVLDPFGPTRREWTEDVDLGDGRVIQVERSVAFNETNSLSGDAYNAVETESTIKFTGDLAKLPPWNQPLMALVLYQDNLTNEWAVVATTTDCHVWQDRGEPAPLYWEFRLTPQGWHEVPLSSASIGRPTNLLHRYQQKLGTKHISVKGRQERESDIGIGEEFKKIVPKMKINCGRALRKS